MTSQTSPIDLQDLSARDVYFLLTSVVVPRPIAWVSTVDGDGRSNLAPFSYFNGVCSDPPLISISIGDHKGQPKDSFRAIQETGVFCVNLVEDKHLEAMHQSSGAYPPEISESRRDRSRASTVRFDSLRSRCRRENRLGMQTR